MTITQVRDLAQANRKEVKRFVKFAMVGTAGATTHFTIVNVLVQIVGLSAVASNPFGFVAAVLQNFFLNRNWTFPESRQRMAHRQLIQFALVSLTGLVINQLVFVTVIGLMRPLWASVTADPEFAYTLGYNFALAVAIGTVLFWNFTANRLWTYRGL